MSINNITILTTSCGGNDIVGKAIGNALETKYDGVEINYENKGDELL